MNIFFLDRIPQHAAKYHCDKHVVKMVLESAQLLSTAHRLLDGQSKAGKSKSGRNVKRWTLNDYREGVLYQAGHVNHPCAVWVRANIDHYRYVYDLLYFLIAEYRSRYGKTHKCEALLGPLLSAPNNISFDAEWIDPPQCMPDDVKVPTDTVLAYRQYYTIYKADMAKWSYSNEPNWWNKVIQGICS